MPSTDRGRIPGPRGAAGARRGRSIGLGGPPARAPASRGRPMASGPGGIAARPSSHRRDRVRSACGPPGEGRVGPLGGAGRKGRRHPSSDPHQPQAHDRQEGNRAQRWVRASSPPRRVPLRSPFQIVGNVCCRRRPSPRVGRPAAPFRCVRDLRGPRVLASFTVRYERRSPPRAGIRRVASAAARWRSPHRRRARNASNLSEANGRSIARRSPVSSLPTPPGAIMGRVDPWRTLRRGEGR